MSLWGCKFHLNRKNDIKTIQKKERLVFKKYQVKNTVNEKTY